MPSRDRGRRSQACLGYAMARTDDKPRGEAEFTQTIPKYRAADIQRKLIAKEEDEVKTKAKPTDIVISDSTCMLILLVA